MGQSLGSVSQLGRRSISNFLEMKYREGCEGWPSKFVVFVCNPMAAAWMRDRL
jgi:hypothetical protein